MSHYTKEDIIRIVEEEDVEFIRLQFVDIFGILKMFFGNFKNILENCLKKYSKMTG